MTPPASTEPQCVAAEQALPDQVAGAGRRPTTPESPAVAAWGDPPIVWRCGVPRPAALTQTSRLLELDGVSWLPETLTAGTAFTAVDWPTASDPVYIEVVVPAVYAPEARALADLLPALR